MDDHASREDHQKTLAWLDSSLEWARAKDRTGLVELLNHVRTEILFDMDSFKNASPDQGRATANGSASGANRGT